jgi:hypothetical protein
VFGGLHDRRHVPLALRSVNAPAWSPVWPLAGPAGSLFPARSPYPKARHHAELTIVGARVFIKALTAIMFILLAIILCAIGTWLVNKEIVKENHDYRIEKTREKIFNTSVGSVCILVNVFIFLGNIVYIVMILG